jgi:heme exporter protein B
MRAVFLAIVKRDLRLALRSGGDDATALLFFVLVATLIPLGVGPAPELLQRIAPGTIWIAALLAVLLSLDRMFRLDQDSGGLDLIATSRAPLGLTVAAKCLAHWLATGLPLVCVAPLVATLLRLEFAAMPVLLFSLLLGTPILSLIGAVGAALVLGARRGTMLLPLILLPLYVPVLIFGSAALEAVLVGLDPQPHLLLLGALLLAALALCPFAATAALRQALD